MSVVTESMNYRSTAGLVAQPAHRRFLSDLTDERGVIPSALLHYDDLARLDEARRRLVDALKAAQAPSDPPQMGEQEYIAARAKALREGTEPPAAPKTDDQRAAAIQQRQRDAQAANDALLALADEICQTVREHPEYEDEGRAHITGLRERAAEMRRQADAAEREAEAAQYLVQWLERVAQNELYVVSLPT